MSEGIRKIDKNHLEHVSYPIWLNPPENEEDTEENNDDIVFSLRAILEKIAASKKCPNCGGLVPELYLNYKGKEYFLTCYQIVENDKLIAQTDYKKFAKYCTLISEKKG